MYFCFEFLGWLTSASFVNFNTYFGVTTIL